MSSNEIPLINPCPKDPWRVYNSGLPGKPPPAQVGLNVSFYKTTPDGKVEPNETIIIQFTTKTKDLVVFHVDFGDGTKKITPSGSTSHFYTDVGTYKVNVTAVGYEVTDTKFVTVKVERVERGIAPQIMELEAADSSSSLTADIFFIAAGMGPISCNLDFGEGNIVSYSDLQEYVNVMNATHTYSLPGFYDVKLSCSNEHGTTEDRLTVLSVNQDLESETIPVSIDVQVPMRGANLHDVTVLLDSKAIDAHKNKSGVVVTPDLFPSTGRHVVTVMSADNFTINKRVVNILSPISALNITPNTVHSVPSRYVNLTFSVQHGDHLFTRISYGDSRQEFVYKQHPQGTFMLGRSVNYKHYGFYTVRFEVANDISYGMIESSISIERPINEAKMEGMNVTRLLDRTVFTFTVDPGVKPELPVDAEINYGNGVTETVRLNPDPTHPYIRNHSYVYPVNGIYRVTAKVFNNISSVLTSALVHVGENITLVDAWTDRDRITARQDANIFVYCPYGSPVTYVIDFGDGVTLDKTYMNLISDVPEGVTPTPLHVDEEPHFRSKREARNDTGIEDENLDDVETVLNDTTVIRVSNDSKTTIRTPSSTVRRTTVLSTTPAPTPPPTTMKPKEPSNLIKLFNHRYKEPGIYKVKVLVKNTFGQKETWVCPSITVVDPANSQTDCNDVKVSPVNKSSMASPLVALRSDNITLRTKASYSCKGLKARFNWKTQRATSRWNWRPELNFCETNNKEPYVVIPHRTLWYGLYKITVTMGLNVQEQSRKKREIEDGEGNVLENGEMATDEAVVEVTDIPEIPVTQETVKEKIPEVEVPEDDTLPTTVTDSAIFYLEVKPSPLVAHIKGEPERDLAKWEPMSIDMSRSNDPDVLPRNRSGLTFHLVCFPEEQSKWYQSMSTDKLIESSTKIGNSSDSETILYDAGGCFMRTNQLFVSETQVSFTAGELSMNDTMVFKLIVRKDVREAVTEQRIKVSIKFNSFYYIQIYCFVIL